MGEMMTLEFVNDYPFFSRGKGCRSLDRQIYFPSPVNKATLAVVGFRFVYDEQDEDHHTDSIEIYTNLKSISGNFVNYSVAVTYDTMYFYTGMVQIVAIADVE